MLYKKVLLPLILFVIVFIPVVTLFFFFRSSKIEDNCIQQAKNIVGENWSASYSSLTPEEKQQSPGLKGGITPGYREELKCERNQKLFFLF